MRFFIFNSVYFFINVILVSDKLNFKEQKYIKFQSMQLLKM